MLTLDIASVVVIYFMDTLEPFFVEWVLRLYIISIVWVAGSLFLYLLSDVLPRKKFKALNKYFDLITVLESVLVAVLPIEIDPQIYSHGPAVNAVYTMAALDFCAAFFCIAYFRSKLSARRIFGVLLWLAIWISFASIQFFHNDLLIVGFAVTLGMIILFALLENPDAKLDRQFSCFNFYTLKSCFKTLLEDKAEFSVLAIYFRNIEQVRESSIEKSSRALLNITRRYSKVKIFKNVNWEFVCLAEDPSQIKALAEDLLGAIGNGKDDLGDLVMVHCLKAGEFHNEYEISQACKFALLSHSEDPRYKEISQEIIDEYRRRRYIDNELELALNENRVEIFFQPIYSAIDDKVQSAEVLARIRLKDGSLLMPREFIPVAENSGKIYDLGILVFEQACKFLKENPNVVSCLNINLSVDQLQDERFGREVLAIMEKYAIVADQLVFELPGVIPAKTMIVHMKNLEILLRKGIQFALDNFGAEDINLMRIAEMHVNFIKLDVELCKACFRDIKFAHIVGSMQKMTKDLNLKVVAEGVESVFEFNGIQKQGIEYVQGFYFSKPLPKNEFLNFMAKNANNVIK